MDTSALQDEKCFLAVQSNKNHSWGKVCASMIIGLSSQIDYFDLLAGGRVKNSVHFCNWLKIIQGRVDLGIKAVFTGLQISPCLDKFYDLKLKPFFREVFRFLKSSLIFWIPALFPMQCNGICIVCCCTRISRFISHAKGITIVQHHQSVTWNKTRCNSNNQLYGLLVKIKKTEFGTQF